MKRLLIFVAALAVLTASCVSEEPVVRIVAHDFFAVSDEVIAAFEEETGIDVRIVQGGDAGAVVNQAILTKGNPVGDVLFGVDNTLLSRALDAEIFERYESFLIPEIPDQFELSPFVTPIDYGDVCINYDKSAFGDDLPPPSTLEDLADPRYRGMLVVEDPTVSSPGLAFMLATIVRFGESGDYTWLDYWADLRQNDVSIAADWGTAYYGMFSGAGDGDRPIVVSYATSPAAEVFGAEPPIPELSTAAMQDGCYRQIEFAGVLVNSDHPQNARTFIDFMLSLEFQEDVPGQMFVYPVRPDAELPAWFGDRPQDTPTGLDPATIEANRERWLAEWSDAVLR
ncbi:MAG TPA: thiamine ABC transporter substrate-binding protein [Acidimicrobiia bacterium]|nr:thiamine ABC transporter substrate-binding protein [Acidimicrobiia bacterium]